MGHFQLQERLEGRMICRPTCIAEEDKRENGEWMLMNNLQYPYTSTAIKLSAITLASSPLSLSLLALKDLFPKLCYVVSI